MLNEILHHVGMSWITSSNKEMKYEMDKNNHQDWLNKGPWYNRSICLKLHGSTFEYFITHARTYRLLIDMTSNFSSSLIKRNSNMENSLNNDSISPLFVFIIFAVCSIMGRKWNHWIVYFIDVGKYSSLLWQLIFFSKKVYEG